MSQRDRDHLLSGLIELDDAYFGGVCEGRYGRGTGQSKAAVAVAINDEGYPTYAKIRVVNAFTQDDINDSMVAVAEQGSTFLTDGLGAWRGLDQVGFEHKPEANANVPEGVEPFPCVHTLISNANAKAWLARSTGSAPPTCKTTWMSSASATTAARWSTGSSSGWYSPSAALVHRLWVPESCREPGWVLEGDPGLKAGDARTV